MEHYRPPLNTYTNVEKTSGLRVDFVFEGKRVVGLHNTEFEDVVKDLDFLIKAVSIYRDEMADYYGQPTKKYRSSFYTYIYLMYDSATGFYKIGRSINPKRRERTLISERECIRSIFVSPKCHRSIEKKLHQHFKEKGI